MNSSAHPVDALGLPLPDASWPDVPGSAGPLEPVRRLANTVNREAGADAWRTVEGLRSWMDREGLSHPEVEPTDLERAVALRNALADALDERSFAPLAAVLGPTDLRATVVDGRLALRPTGSAADELIAIVVTAVVCSQHDGSWSRLKCCQRCRWVFVDTSHGRTGRWCSMRACGARAKAQAYRDRRAGRGVESEVAP